MTEDIVPATVNSGLEQRHRHKWYAFQIKNSFEPINIGTGQDNIYQMIEYMYYSCPCGAAHKSIVEKKEDDQIN